MIGFLEGDSCAGKTTVLGTLKEDKDFENLFVVSELLLFDEDTNMDKNNNNNYIKNDLYKIQQAKTQSELGKIVLLDRSYISTLGYDYIRIKLNEENTYTERSQIVDNELKKGHLVYPDFVLHFSIPENIQIMRKEQMNKNDIFRKTGGHLDIFYKSRYANNHDIKVLYIDGSKKLHHIVGLIKTFLFSLGLMASKIEKEVNFLISNYPGIIALLDKEMTFAGEQKILFSYYHNHSDPSIYGRIESYIEQGKITNKIITLKRNVTIEGGLKIRKEFSFSIDNDEDSSMFFDIIGLSYTNSKGKIRRIYKNTEGNVEFDVDSRYNQTFDQKTEDRIEIETDSDDSIAIYSSFIKNYVVNEN